LIQLDQQTELRRWAGQCRTSRVAASGTTARQLRCPCVLGRRRLGEVRLPHELSHLVLCVRILDRAQEREVAALAMKGELARRKRDAESVAVATFPDAESDQLQSVELAAAEVQLGVGQLVARMCFGVSQNLRNSSGGVRGFQQ
jgi:hypothetical protein